MRVAAAKLTPIGQELVESINELAAYEFLNRAVPNHRPASPMYWFAGLAREWAEPPESGGTVFERPGICAHFTDETVVLLRELGIRPAGCRVGAARQAELAALRGGCSCGDECRACVLGIHQGCDVGCLLRNEQVAA